MATSRRPFPYILTFFLPPQASSGVAVFQLTSSPNSLSTYSNSTSAVMRHSLFVLLSTFTFLSSFLFIFAFLFLLFLFFLSPLSLMAESRLDSVTPLSVRRVCPGILARPISRFLQREFELADSGKTRLTDPSRYSTVKCYEWVLD